MEGKNNNIKKLVCAIVGILIILLFLLVENNLELTSTNDTTPVDNSSEVNHYDNIGIDEDLLNIIYFNVGQADSTLITINDKVMLIDAGNGSDGHYISEFLKAQNISQIDYLIGTHIDEDHVGGLYKIIENFEIGNLYMPESTITSKKFYIDLQETMNKNNVKRTPVEVSDTTEYNLGNASWKILYVDNSDPKSEEKFNDTSIVIELTYKETKYLFMGDTSSKVEETINWNKVNVLKVAHHGSDTSTSLEFLKSTFPDYAIISTNGRYGAPSIDMLNRLDELQKLKIENNQDLKIYRTDLHNTIWLTSDGTGIESIWIEELNYNLDGANRKISLLDNLNLLYAISLYNYKDHLAQAVNGENY